MISGHDRIVARIERDGLPSVSLFVGPKSVGKTNLANHLARDLTDDPQDVFRINRLTADLARNVSRFIHVAPHGTRHRVVIANIESAPLNNLNVLLKSLEDVPPLMSKVMLLATTPPPATIISRAEAVYTFSLLTDHEVQEALVMRGFGKTEAEIRAAESGGQMSTVYGHEETANLKKLVLIVARCFRERDNAALEALAPRWTEEHTALLVKLAHEATTKRWRIFDEAEVGLISGRVWLAILKALKTPVRPRLTIHAQLAGVLRSIS